MQKIGEIKGMVKIYAERLESGEIKYVINRFIPSIIYPFMPTLGEGRAHEIKAVVVTAGEGFISYEVFNREMGGKRMIGMVESQAWIDFAKAVCGENFIKKGVC